ncbi:endonuclease VIII [Lysobacter brunescens]|uniref:DNA-(apurinic or apyrimidinic site) lyase n=1 Tax=Lysobacter brunescens TaxID=262323 RepID=A0ABW2YKZ4_9GAMM
MPEGPEIRRAADALAAAVVGRPLARAWFWTPALQRHAKDLVGRTIESITPHGKALLTRFDHGWTLYSHNQLYGVWKVAAAGERPDTTRSLRVALETADRAILLYSASDVAMWRSDEVHQHPFLVKLGPDVLDPALDAATVAARLREPRFRGRALAALLLDQGFLAGMGNYLRSEVLFAAKLAPDLRPADLGAAQVRALAKALLDIPRRSYATRGIEAASGMREDYLTDTPEGFRFKVFDREGQPCERCRTTIVREEHGTRRLYLCPRCQLPTPVN